MNASEFQFKIISDLRIEKIMKCVRTVDGLSYQSNFDDSIKMLRKTLSVSEDFEFNKYEKK